MMASTKEHDLLALTEQIEAIAADAQRGNHPQNESIRRRLGEAGLKLSLAMEAPHDTVHRIGNTVSCKLFSPFSGYDHLSLMRKTTASTISARFRRHQDGNLRDFG
jgi:hypothetical protein